MPLTPTLGRQKQVDLCESEVSLFYKVSFRTRRATEREKEIKPISKKPANQKKRKERKGKEKKREAHIFDWSVLILIFRFHNPLLRAKLAPRKCSLLMS